MAKATGMSTTAIQIAMNGYRYRDGKATVTMPPDSTVVKMASVLRVSPAALRDVNRVRAAELLEEATTDLRTTTSTDQSAMAMSAGRQALAHQVLAAFSTEELRAEIEHRDNADDEAQDAQTYAELTDDLKSAQYPG